MCMCVQAKLIDIEERERKGKKKKCREKSQRTNRNTSRCVRHGHLFIGAEEERRRRRKTSDERRFICVRSLASTSAD